MGAVVECHSGHTYAERPRAFIWDDARLEIEALMAEWQTPLDKRFRVIANNGQTFELVYIFASDQWQIFQEEKIKS
jgi:hypothetical protein